MKCYSGVFLALLMMCACHGSAEDKQESAWGPLTNGAQMSITCKGGDMGIAVNRPVDLLIRYRNGTTNRTFCIYVVNGTVQDPEYSFIVKSPSGKDISPDLKKFWSESGSLISLRPGENKAVEFRLSSICKFEEVGTYEVVAKKVLLSVESNKAFQVVSNPLRVSVVPGGENTNDASKSKR